MKVQFHFRKVEWTDEIVEYFMHRLEKLEKYEWRPLSAHVTFTSERHSCVAEIRVEGRRLNFKANAKAESFADAIDAAVMKLQRQLERKKTQLKSHRIAAYAKDSQMAMDSEDAEFIEDLPIGRRAG